MEALREFGHAARMTLIVLGPFAALAVLVWWAARGGLAANVSACALAFVALAVTTAGFFTQHWTKGLFWQNAGHIVFILVGIQVTVRQWRRVAQLRRKRTTSALSDGYGG